MRGERISFLAMGLLFGGMASPAQSQIGDAAAGEAYAEKVCAQCHAIHRTGLSPDPNATPFKDVADTPGMTETALRVWLSTRSPQLGAGFAGYNFPQCAWPRPRHLARARLAAWRHRQSTR
jgi:hypothetical protein